MAIPKSNSSTNTEENSLDKDSIPVVLGEVVPPEQGEVQAKRVKHTRPKLDAQTFIVIVVGVPLIVIILVVFAVAAVLSDIRYRIQKNGKS